MKAAETAGGYAKEMSKEYQAKQAALVADHIAKQDIVITTALHPGASRPKAGHARAAPARMRKGSVLIDLRGTRRQCRRVGCRQDYRSGRRQDRRPSECRRPHCRDRLATALRARTSSPSSRHWSTRMRKPSRSISTTNWVKATVLTHGGQGGASGLCQCRNCSVSTQLRRQSPPPARRLLLAKAAVAKEAPVQTEAKKAAPRKAATPKAKTAAKTAAPKPAAAKSPTILQPQLPAAKTAQDGGGEHYWLPMQPSTRRSMP